MLDIPSPTSIDQTARFPAPDGILDEFAKWLNSPDSAHVDYAYEPFMLMEFANFLLVVKLRNRMLDEDQLLSLFRRWLAQLPRESRFTNELSVDETAMSKFFSSPDFKPFDIVTQYKKQGRFFPINKAQPE